MMYYITIGVMWRQLMMMYESVPLLYTWKLKYNYCYIEES